MRASRAKSIPAEIRCAGTHTASQQDALLPPQHGGGRLSPAPSSDLRESCGAGERRVRMNPRLFMRKELLTHAEGGVEGKGAGELGRSGLFPQTVELRGAPPRGPGEG